MASSIARLIQDQNLNVHSNGGSLVGKGNHAQKKMSLGGRQPLGDLSNRGKPDVTKTSKKSAYSNIPKIIADKSSKNDCSKASNKLIRSSRKALTDVSNITKPLQKKKSSVVGLVAEEEPCDFENEGFLHDHQKCIEAMKMGNHIEEIYESRRPSSPLKISQFGNFEADYSRIWEEVPDSPPFPPYRPPLCVLSPPASPASASYLLDYPELDCPMIIPSP